MLYVSFAPETEIIGRSVLILFNKEFPFINPSVKELMIKYGLYDIKEDQWYPEQPVFDALKEIAEHHGDPALELIGFLTLSEIHSLPVTDLEADFLYFDTGYQLTHRNGLLGYYELIAFNEKEKTAIMESYTPYPPALNKGFLKAIVRKHVSPETNVEIVATSATNEEGETIDQFHISWE